MARHEGNVRAREKSREKGERFYTSPLLCPLGHSERYTAHGGCRQCKIDRSRKEAIDRRDDAAYNRRRRNASRKFRKKQRATSEGREQLARIQARYINANRDKVNKYYRDKLSEDALFKSAALIRSILNRHLKQAGIRKDCKTEGLLGYSKGDLLTHLERQFKSGMRWDNHGTYWHVDHILPIKYFMDRGVHDPSVVNALANLRPLCAVENIKKRARRTHLL